MNVSDSVVDSMILPNFVICGAPKAGTSSLHVWLADHPDALGSSEKETYFCVDSGTHMYRPYANITGGLKGYEQYFNLPEDAKPKILLESTPSYLYSKTALKFIPDLHSQPKCLFVLREPAAQIYSMFNYFQTNWSWIPGDLSFGDYIKILRDEPGKELFNGNELASDALKNASYVDFLVDWRERLGADRIMVQSFDSFKADPKAFTKQLAAWLGLDPDFYDTYDFPSDNETYAVRNKLLQRINVVVRGLLPRGIFYRFLKKVYRGLNTHKPKRPDIGNRALVAELALEFKADNDRLRLEFDLELSGWA
jgi:hypothetical protein